MGGSTAGGGKSSTSSSSTSSPYAPILAGWGSQLFRMARPVLGNYANQVNEALQTGGVNSQIPAINAATSAQREGNSQSLTELRQNLAKTGLANTSFGNALIQQQQMQGNQNVANTGPTMAQNLISSGVPNVMGIASQGVGAEATAAGLDTTTNSQYNPSLLNDFSQGASMGGDLGAAFAGFGGAGAGGAGKGSSSAMDSFLGSGLSSSGTATPAGVSAFFGG